MTRGGGFFGRFRAGEDETRFYSPEELGRGEPEEEPVDEQPGFTVEKAARIIDDLPPDVSRESALHIVRETLMAAGVDLADLERQSRAKETKLHSEMGLARGRREDLKRRTEEVLGSLEEEIRKAREARNTGVASEEEHIARARKGLGEVRRVRAFFGFPEVELDDPEEGSGDETQVLEGPILSDQPVGADPEETQILPRRPQTPFWDDPDDRAGGEGAVR
jgi:hypothetical protein